MPWKYLKSEQHLYRFLNQKTAVDATQKYLYEIQIQIMFFLVFLFWLLVATRFVEKENRDITVNVKNIIKKPNDLILLADKSKLHSASCINESNWRFAEIALNIMSVPTYERIQTRTNTNALQTYAWSLIFVILMEK